MIDYQNTRESRLERGRRILAEIDGDAGERVIASLADIAPDFARYLLEFPFGDIYSRPGLDVRDREIATVAALTALGNAGPQLKVHIEASLNVGLTRVEITEIIMQMAVYAGFQWSVCSQRSIFQSDQHPGCLIPGLGGAVLSIAWKEAPWGRFCTGAPRRRPGLEGSRLTL